MGKHSFWIVSSMNTVNMFGTKYEIVNRQPFTNMRPQPVNSGWLGSTDNVDKSAHGKFTNICEARVALMKLVKQKLIIYYETPFDFDALKPNDYRGFEKSKINKLSELWKKDGSADYLVKTWKTKEETGLNKCIDYLNVTSKEYESFDDVNADDYFTWLNDSISWGGEFKKFCFIRQKNNGDLEIDECKTVWEYALKKGVVV